jgi:hypothetical protein
MVEIIHQHLQRSFLLPAFATDLIAARRLNGSWRIHHHTAQIQI